MSIIYADYAATTPLDPRVLDSMMPYLTNCFYNASSSHAGGLEAQEAVMQARMDVSRHIGARMNEIVFTSGATEAINLAIVGLARGSEAVGQSGSGRNRIVTVASEHAAVLDATAYCRTMGFEVVYLGTKEDGTLDLDEVKSAVDNNTLLLSVMLVNNETGVIQDLKSLSQIAHNVGALFMTDATQAYGKLRIDVDDAGIDLMTFSGHKIYGPKGVGALYRRARKDFSMDIEPLVFGGGQEGGIRSGTLNVPGIVGLSTAGNIAYAEYEKEAPRIASLRDRFEHTLMLACGVTVNGSIEHRNYNISNITFPEIESERLLLDLPHIACSKGSACSSSKPKPSHVLTTMGRTLDETNRSLRFSFGRFTTEQEIDTLIHDLSAALVTA